MKTITDCLQLSAYTSRIFDMYFKDRSFSVFDIETTGLSPSRCKVILSGMLLHDRQGCRVIQHFADQPDDERQIIEQTMNQLEKVDYIITYNGKHFDIPFMEARAKKYGISFDPKVYNLDLFLVVQSCSDLRETLPNLKQKTLEIFMGLSDGRDDKISGGESVILYEQYMQNHAFALEKTILLHNHDDLIQLYRLLPVIAKTDFHKAMYKRGFLSGNFLIKRISIGGKMLTVSGRQLENPVSYISFPTEDNPVYLNLDAAGGFELSVPLSGRAGALYFDAAALLGKDLSAIEKYPSVVNGYLIAENRGTVNHMEINRFLLEYLPKLENLL